MGRGLRGYEGVVRDRDRIEGEGSRLGGRFANREDRGCVGSYRNGKGGVWAKELRIG